MRLPYHQYGYLIHDTDTRSPGLDAKHMNDERERRPLSGQASALVAAALFGLSTPASKVLLLNFSPLMLSGLLYLGAAIALFLYRAMRRTSAEARIKRQD